MRVNGQDTAASFPLTYPNCTPKLTCPLLFNLKLTELLATAVINTFLFK